MQSSCRTWTPHGPVAQRWLFDKANTRARRVGFGGGALLAAACMERSVQSKAHATTNPAPFHDSFSCGQAWPGLSCPMPRPNGWLRCWSPACRCRRGRPRRGCCWGWRPGRPARGSRAARAGQVRRAARAGCCSAARPGRRRLPAAVAARSAAPATASGGRPANAVFVRCQRKVAAGLCWRSLLSYHHLLFLARGRVWLQISCR